MPRSTTSSTAVSSPLPTGKMGSSVPTIPGRLAEVGLARLFQQEVAQLLGRRNLNFPGAQPVSFGRRHFEELHKREYAITVFHGVCS